MIAIAIYLTGSLINLLLALMFREAFTDTQERKRMFAWICSTAAVLSFLLWIAIALVIIIECVKYFNKKKDDEKRTTMLR